MAIIFILFAVSIAVYRPVQYYDFILWDDPGYVYENGHLTDGINWRSIWWAFTDTRMGHWHPLTWLSHMIDVALFGVHPAGHHVMSLVIHECNGILLFLLLLRLTGAFGPSAIVAALFLLHPVNVESVAWIAERKNVLSTLFWMLSLLAYLRYTERPGLLRYAAVFVLFALGLLAKPMLVTLPFVFLLLDFWPLGRWCLPFDARTSWKLLREKIPFCLLSILSAGMTVYAAASVSTIATTELIPLSSRFANAVISYVKYMQMMVWPQDLAFFYPHPVILSMSRFLFSAMVLIAVTAAAFWRYRSYPYLVVGWLWYLVTLVPVIGIVQAGSQALADRYAYVPLIGLFIMGAWGLPDLFRGWAKRRFILAVGACLILASFAGVTVQQLSYWQDSLTLFGHAVRTIPRNYMAHDLYGLALMEQRRFSEAETQFQSAIRAKDDFGSAYNNLGILLMKQGRYDAAIASLAKAARLSADDGEVHFNLAEALSQVGRNEEAVEMYRRAAMLDPSRPKIENNLGVALARQGNHDEAVRAFQRAITLDPGHAGAYNNLAMVFLKVGKIEAAIAEFREAIRLQPNYANAHYYLAEALKSKGLMEEARFHFHEAALINPLYRSP